MRSGEKIFSLYGWLLFAPCLASAGPLTNAALPPTNLLSICAATNVSVSDLTLPDINPVTFRGLITQPILSDQDFVSWNVANHTFVITPQAAKRMLGNNALKCDNWFAVVCSGEPIYFGRFKSLTSSSSCSQPVILTDHILTDCFGGYRKVPDEVWALLRWPGTTNLTERLMAMTNACCNVTLQIDRGYPSDAWGQGPDLRDDERIFSAAAKLFEKRKEDGDGSALKN